MKLKKFTGFKSGRKVLDDEPKPICNRCGACCYFVDEKGILCPCKYLTKEGEAWCTNYEKRPAMCREFWCFERIEERDKAREQAIK